MLQILRLESLDQPDSNVNELIRFYLVRTRAETIFKYYGLWVYTLSQPL